jgi:hypothetical protein
VLELEIQKNVRLALSKAGCTNFRNNVGSAKTFDGRFIRFGLCPGSHDLIGWTEKIITPDMVGKKVAIFTSVETKRPFVGRKSVEQINFHNRVTMAGGISGFATSAAEAIALIVGWGPR